MTRTILLVLCLCLVWPTVASAATVRAELEYDEDVGASEGSMTFTAMLGSRG